MDAAVSQWLREGVVDQPVLVESREPVEACRRQQNLEVIPAPRPITDLELGRIGKRLCEEALQRCGTHHHAMVAAGPA